MEEWALSKLVVAMAKGIRLLYGRFDAWRNRRKWKRGYDELRRWRAIPTPFPLGSPEAIRFELLNIEWETLPSGRQRRRKDPALPIPITEGDLYAANEVRAQQELQELMGRTVTIGQQ